MYCCTFEYMAPEYIKHGIATTKTDLYSLGIVAYELLTGRKPFKGRAAISSFAAGSSNPPEIRRVLREPQEVRAATGRGRGDLAESAVTVLPAPCTGYAAI